MKRATKQRLSLAAIMVLLLSGCGSVGKETKKQEQQVLRVGIDSELSTADVSLAMDNTAADVMSQVGEGLFSFDEKGEAKPALATEKVQPSNDGLIYTFTIRKDAKWSNGERSQPMILNTLGSAQWTQKQLPRKRITLKG